MTNRITIRRTIPGRFRLVTGIFCAAASVLSATGATSGADAVSIEQLLKDKTNGRWASYAESQLPMKIEGRRSSFSPRLLRFLRCEELNFLWYQDDQPFPIDLTSLRSPNLEVYGRFGPGSGKPVFLVEQIRETPSDGAKVQSRRMALVDAPASRWYELADWTMQRGAFYGDSDLQRTARELYAEAIGRERNGLGDDALDAKIALSQKYSRYGLPDDDRLELLHDAFRGRWQSLKKLTTKKAADLESLSDRLAAALPGCGTPLIPDDAPLRARYAHDPLRVYRTATRQTRLQLNRILYVDIRSAFLREWARERAEDDWQLADRIDREAPENHAAAEKLRDKSLEEKLARVKTLERKEMLDLAENFQRRGQPDKALEAKQNWVAAQESRLVQEGSPDDLVQAAHLRQSVLEDSQGAIELLKTAYEKGANTPKSAEIAGELERLGLSRVNGKWMTAAQKAAQPVDPFRQAADAGRFTGMTREQVRKALLSNPDSVTRVISAGQVNEVWIYENGASRLAIQFLGGTDGRDVRVVRLVQ